MNGGSTHRIHKQQKARGHKSEGWPGMLAAALIKERTLMVTVCGAAFGFLRRRARTEYILYSVHFFVVSFYIYIYEI
jgi:hypothetical protein